MTQSAQNSMFAASGIERVAMASSRVRVGRDANQRKQEPHIKLIKNGSTIQSILITCGCGEKIVVNCVYQDDTK